MLGGIWPASRARTTLIMAARPLGVSVWPMFVLTDPIRSGSPGGLFSLNTAAIALASIGSPVGVPFQILVHFLSRVQ
jgi:hypothetical protein